MPTEGIKVEHNKEKTTLQGIHQQKSNYLSRKGASQTFHADAFGKNYLFLDQYDEQSTKPGSDNNIPKGVLWCKHTTQVDL